MLSAPEPALPAGEPPRPVCQRCGRSVDESAIGAQVGLCHCMVCEVYACRWCWADADGTCPSCGVRYAPAAMLAVAPAEDPGVTTAVVAGLAGGRGSAMAGRRPDIRAPLAIGTLVVALALLGLAFGGPLGSTAGLIEATPTPALAVTASDQPTATGSRAAAPSGDAVASEAPPVVPTSTARVTEGTAAPDGSTPDPLAVTPNSIPTPTPTPPPTATPAPTPVPTPRPTPRPTPTPSPTASCKVVPNLVGSTVAAARTAWTAAGFTGALSPTLGHNAAIVTTQDRSVGACLAPSTTVTVGYAKAH